MLPPGLLYLTFLMTLLSQILTSPSHTVLGTPFILTEQPPHPSVALLPINSQVVSIVGSPPWTCTNSDSVINKSNAEKPGSLKS